MNKELNALLTIAYRDWLKLLRDRGRMLASLIFPFVFIGILGTSLQTNLSAGVGYDFMTFVFLGVMGQTFFQSTASGLISLIEDRENDFSQEIFISPISRYTILAGKILGETLVALTQGIGIIAFGLLVRVPFSLMEVIRLTPAVLTVCFFGGAFGLIVMTNLKNQRTANQIFPFLLFPQFFLAGVFNPIRELPWYLWILSRIAPMTYAVDFIRSLYYWGRPEYGKTVLFSPLVNLFVIAAMTAIFMIIGTYLFVRNERNR